MKIEAYRIQNTAVFFYIKGRREPVKVHATKQQMNAGYACLTGFQKSFTPWVANLKDAEGEIVTVRNCTLDPVIVVCCRRGYSVRNDKTLITTHMLRRLHAPSPEEAEAELSNPTDLFGREWPISQQLRTTLAESMGLT
jgi:hypothetical protein